MRKAISGAVRQLFGIIGPAWIVVALAFGIVAASEKEQERVYMKIGDVTVTEKSPVLAATDLPTSVDVLGSSEIENQNVNFSMELFRKMPGTYYGDWNQGVVSGTFSVRGFDANHEVPLALLVDGIPHNFGYGRMDIQPIFPLEIDWIELVKGTNDPRYGLNNVAGNVNVFTKRGGDFSQARVLAGSYNTYDANMIIGRQPGNFSQTYFVGYRQTDGYRDNADLMKGAASGKWFYHTSDQRLSLGAIARVFGMDANAPGYLTKAQAAENSRQAAPFARTDGGEQKNTHLSVHLDYALLHNVQWSFKMYGQQLHRTRWATFSPAGAQQERINEDNQYGAISTLSYQVSNRLFQRLKLDWGLDYQFQDNLDQRYITENRVRTALARDWDYDQHNLGSYLQADGRMTDWLRIHAGLRLDRLDGSLENRLADVKTDMIDFGNIWQPKVGLVLTPVRAYSLYANWGRSFQVPAAQSTAYGQSGAGALISRDFSYSKNDGWEAGVRVAPAFWLSARAAYWNQTATDEIRPKGDGSGDFINAGETERKGWDFVLNLYPHSWISVWSSYSVIDAKYTQPGPGLTDREGKKIENIPGWVAKLGIDFEHPTGFFTNCWLEAQADYYLDPQNEREKEGDYTLVNLTVGYTFPSLTIGFDIKNVLDEKYNAFVWNSTWGFNPGPERSYYAWVKLDF
jgi:iron complex outermembrane recepter protein